MGIRDRGKKLLEQGKRQAKRARGALEEQADRSLALQRTMERLGIAGKWTWEKFEEALQAVEDKMKQHMGFDMYRAELETALEEAMAVIAAQEERIRLLEQRAAKQQ
jgi:two-component sensor histidine kinase